MVVSHALAETLGIPMGAAKRVDVRTRLMDVELLVVKRLGELPYAAYLCAMCVIATEIREVYFAFLSENGRALSSKTIDAVSAAVSDEGGGGGFELVGEWERLIADPAEDGPSGWFAAAYTFRDLAWDLTGERASRTALTWLTNTAVNLPEDGPAERSARVWSRLILIKKLMRTAPSCACSGASVDCWIRGRACPAGTALWA